MKILAFLEKDNFEKQWKKETFYTCTAYEQEVYLNEEFFAT